MCVYENLEEKNVGLHFYCFLRPQGKIEMLQEKGKTYIYGDDRGTSNLCLVFMIPFHCAPIPVQPLNLL